MLQNAGHSLVMNSLCGYNVESASDEEDAVDEEEDEPDEDEPDEDEPPAKRTRQGSKAALTPTPPKKGRRGQKKTTPTPKKSPGQKRKSAQSKPKKEKKKKDVVEKKEKPRRAGVLIPNEDIELLEKDPTFETRFVDKNFLNCLFHVYIISLKAQ